MKENFPNLVMEIDIQIEEAERVPNKMDPNSTTPRYIIVKMPKVKDKERNLKGPGEKQLVTCRGFLIRLSANFSKETLQARRARNMQSDEKQGPTTKMTLPSKAII